MKHTFLWILIIFTDNGKKINNLKIILDLTRNLKTTDLQY